MRQAVKRLNHVGLGAMPLASGGKRPKNTYIWYRGETCNYGPTLDHLEDWTGYRDYFLTGLSPAQQFITPETNVTAFGSCFAGNISNWLAERNFRILNKTEQSSSYVVTMGEGFVTSYSIRQQFDWALENKEPHVETWHGYDGESLSFGPEIKEQTRQLFSRTDLFILTFGLSEVWYDKVTGDVFWRAIPREQFDADRHGFRIVSTDENYENIRSTIETIIKHRPNAKIILTLSPIPLAATFRPIPCTTANSVSKASLRLAIDKVVSNRKFENQVYYWPSYEIVNDGFLRKWKDDRRHVKAPILSFIMSLFERTWCAGGLPDRELARALLAAKIADGSVPPRRFTKLDKVGQNRRLKLVAMLKKRNRTRLAETIIAAYPPEGPVSSAEHSTEAVPQ